MRTYFERGKKGNCFVAGQLAGVQLGGWQPVKAFPVYGVFIVKSLFLQIVSYSSEGLSKYILMVFVWLVV